MSRSIRVAVLTVSDTASTNASADKSGPAIRAIVQKHGFQCDDSLIVADDVVQIQAAVLKWCSKRGIDLILTSGGTGFGVRDRTPEAIAPLLERDASGLVHLMLSASLKHTPLAALSRPVAGTTGNKLIITLPGSVKAVEENLAALLSDGVLDHAVDLAKGGTGKRIHEALASSSQTAGAIGSIASAQVQEHTHHHRYHHDHGHHAPQPRSILSHDPSLPSSARHRVSPYPMISMEEALSLIMTHTATLPKIRRRVDADIRGYVLAEDVYASQDFPNLPTTSVDGYAIRSSNPTGVFKVVTSRPDFISPGDSIFQINTGATLPAGTDAVIMVEDTRLISTEKDADGKDTEEKEVETLVQIPVGENVRDAGSDVRKGDLVLSKGAVLRSAGGEIGALVFVGRKEADVFKKPCVALLSTGNEIVELQSHSDTEGTPGAIWDTNRPSLQAALEGMGYEVKDLGIVTDDVSDHVQAIKKGLNDTDILITTGGTSMGSSDLLKPVIERKLNGTIHFGRVAMKPGKPTTFATIPTSGDVAAKPVFALPGNPASALVCFHLFVLPALRKLGGWPSAICQLPRVKVKLLQAIKLDSRKEFHRIVISYGRDGLEASSTGGQRSSRVASLCDANGLAILPSRSSDGRNETTVGEMIEAVVIGELRDALKI